MTLPASVEALVNERTGKYFIVLDWEGEEEGRIKTINPLGNILDVPSVIFKVDEPKNVGQSEYSSIFTAEQITTLERWEKDRFSRPAKRAASSAAKSSSSSQSGKVSSPKPRAGSSRKEGLLDKSMTSSGRRPTVQWTSDTLVFFRHKIEGLKPSDVFACVITDKGTFSMTKSEFQRKFNNVIMSPEYSNQGIYRYSSIPEDAIPFIK